MGCYGIGITRVVAAAIEQNHDAKGIIWPLPLAPFAVAIAPVGYDRSEAVRTLADRLHDELESAGIEVLLDDRGERPGVMFADLELIGIPHRITIGERGLKDGNVEYQARRGGGGGHGAAAVPVAEIAPSSEGTAFGMTFFGTWRTARRRSLVPAALALSPLAARAGAQVEEQLAPSVVTVLSAAISDRPVPADYGYRADIRPGSTRCRAASRRR